ncbi:hypothetical protein OJ253_760, partial [Cryptosporidium canis]
MGEQDLRVVASKLRRLRSESECKSHINKDIFILINDVVLLNFLRSYMSELEGHSGTSSNRKDLLSVKLVNEFLNVAQKRLTMSEYRMEKEDPRILMSELKQGVEECLYTASGFILKASRVHYFRWLLSREFPSILKVLLVIAGSNLLETQLRCKVLQATLEFMKNQKDDKISQSICFRKCLSEGEEDALTRLWKSLCQHKELHMSKLVDSNKEYTIAPSSRQNACSDNPSMLLIILILEIFSNILHFQRHLTDSLLNNLSIEILCGDQLDLILELSISPHPKIGLFSGIILRSLLLDSTEDQYSEINRKIKSCKIILVYLARAIYQGSINHDDRISLDQSVLYAQIVSILSQYDPEIYDLITRIFPKKFFRILENRWFKVLPKHNLDEHSNLMNVLPWFPTNCTWYDMKTNVLASDSSFPIQHGSIFLDMLRSKITSLNLSCLEDVLRKSQIILPQALQIPDSRSAIQEFLSIYHQVRELTTRCCSSLLNGSNRQLLSPDIRRHPDFAWYIFWSLCRNDYADQLDLIWDQSVKNEVISLLIREFNQTSHLGGSSKPHSWNIRSFFPEIPKISREIQISDSIYLRLLIPTLMRINQTFGLFHPNKEILGKNTRVCLDLQNPQVANLGNLLGYYFNSNILGKGGTGSQGRHIDRRICQKSKGLRHQICDYLGVFKSQLVNSISHHPWFFDRSQHIRPSSKDDFSIPDLVINHCLDDWQVIQPYSERIDHDLNEKLFQGITRCQVPYLECIENVEKVEILVESLFQKMVSETKTILKNYMLYGYMYCIVVFSEYLSGKQVTRHLQYFITLLLSGNQSDQFYRGLLVYIMHIILTVYEETRHEFIKMGGFIFLSEFLMYYQKGWSASKQLSIYYDQDVLNEIISGLDRNQSIDWERYLEIFRSREAHVRNYKLIDVDIGSESSMNCESLKIGEHGLNLVHEFKQPQIFVIEIPEIQSLMSDGIFYQVNHHLTCSRTNLEEIKSLDHKQFMNVWMMIMNEDQLKISIRDSMGLGDQFKGLISCIPSEVGTSGCFGSGQSNTPTSQSSKQLVLKEDGQAFDRLYRFDLLNYRELLLWLITINNCISLSEVWLSECIKNDQFIHNMITLLLIKNKIFHCAGTPVKLKDNYHIFWISHILRRVLVSDPNLIFKMMDYQIIEILILAFMRFDSPVCQDSERVRDEVIQLFRICLVTMNKCEKKFVDDWLKREGECSSICNSGCNFTSGCVYGDMTCLVFHLLDYLGVQRSLQLEESRMAQVFGNGVFYASRYIPISILQILEVSKEDHQSLSYEKIQEFKKSLGLCGDGYITEGIRIQWGPLERMHLLIKLSRVLYYHSLEVDQGRPLKVEILPFVNHSSMDDFISIDRIKSQKQCKDLNILGYNLNRWSQRISEYKNQNFLEKMNISSGSHKEIVDQWFNLSRQSSCQSLLEVLELDKDKMTRIFRNHLQDEYGFVSNPSVCIYINLWNTLQYYLYVYFIFYLELSDQDLNQDSIFKILIQLLELQRNLLIIGVSYIYEYKISIINWDLEYPEGQDSLFHQFFDQYYHLINNHNKKNQMVIYNLSLCNIIGSQFLLKRHSKNSQIFNISLSILNLIGEYLNYYSLELNGLIDKELSIEKFILVNKLKKKSFSEIDLLRKNIILETLFNYDNFFSQDQIMLNLVLYRIYQRFQYVKVRNEQLLSLDPEIFDLLSQYLLTMELRYEKSIDLIIIKIIKEYIKFDSNNSLKIVKNGLFSKLLNALISQEYTRIQLKKEIYEILLYMYNKRDNVCFGVLHAHMDVEANIVHALFESLLTPAICRILKNGDYEVFLGVIQGEIVTNEIIWTKGMYKELLEWRGEKNNNEILSYKRRYYKIINSYIDDKEYDFLREEYIMGIYKLLYIRGDYGSFKLGIFNSGEIIDYVFKILSNNLLDGIDIDGYLYLIYKMLLNEGLEKCKNDLIVEYIKVLGNLMEYNIQDLMCYFLLERSNKYKIGLGRARVVYILGIVEEIRNDDLFFQFEEKSLIRVEIDKIIIRIILYIQENFLLKDLNRIIRLDEIMNEDMESILLTLKELIQIHIMIKDTRDLEYYELKILLFINMMMIIFKYEILLKSLNNGQELLLKEIVDKYMIKVSKDQNDDFYQLFKMIMYPLNSEEMMGKIQKLLIFINDDKPRFLLEILRDCINQEKNTRIDLRIECLIKDYNNVIFDWNNHVRLQIYNNLINIRNRIRELDNKKMNLKILKKIIRFENYKGMIQEYKTFEMESRNYKIQEIQLYNTMDEYCTKYILKLLIIQEIKYLNNLLKEDNNNKRLDLEIIMMKKFQEIFKLFTTRYDNNNNNIVNIIRSEDKENMNNYLIDQEDQSIYMIGNIHPNLRMDIKINQEMLIDIKRSSIKDDLDLDVYYNYNKSNALILLEEMIMLLIKDGIEYFNTRNMRKLLKLIDNILMNMIIYTIEENMDKLYIGINLEIDLIG